MFLLKMFEAKETHIYLKTKDKAWIFGYVWLWRVIQFVGKCIQTFTTRYTYCTIIIIMALTFKKLFKKRKKINLIFDWWKHIFNQIRKSFLIIHFQL